ncbi:MAG: AfsR/SARP family transcriptional regulator [Saprospiraceae bacterium]
MKKLEVIVFHSDTVVIKFDEFIPQQAGFSTYPLQGAEIPVECAIGPKTIVLIWDTTQSRQGILCLEAIRRISAKVPVCMVAENPTEAYILAALRLHAHDFFRLTENTSADIRRAIQDIMQESQQTWTAKQGHWLNFFSRRTADMWQLFKQLGQPIQNPASQHMLGIVAPQASLWFNDSPEKEYASDISVQFFGAFRLKIKGKSVPDIKGKKNAEVLAYLLYHHEKSMHKDVLMEKFWGHVNTVSARNSLNVAICNLRKHLGGVYPGGEIIVFENDNYRINPNLDVTTDIDKFQSLWKKGRAVETEQGLHQAVGVYHKAIEVYKDEFLSHIRYEEWCESERDKLKETCLFMLHRVSTHLFERKNYEQCVHICQRMLEKDPCLEEVHRKLMVCFYHLGHHDLATKQYTKCEKILEKELSLSPSEATRNMYLGIKNGKLPRADAKTF